MSENLKLVTWALNEMGANIPLIIPPSKSDGLPKTVAPNSQNSNYLEDVEKNPTIELKNQVSSVNIRDEIYVKNRVEIMKNSRPLSPLFIDTNLENCDKEFKNFNADSAVIINKEVFEEMGDENSENYVSTPFVCFANSKNLEEIKKFEHAEAKSSQGLGISENLIKIFQINSKGNNQVSSYSTYLL